MSSALRPWHPADHLRPHGAATPSLLPPMSAVAGSAPHLCPPSPFFLLWSRAAAASAMVAPLVAVFRHQRCTSAAPVTSSYASMRPQPPRERQVLHAANMVSRSLPETSFHQNHVAPSTPCRSSASRLLCSALSPLDAAAPAGARPSSTSRALTAAAGRHLQIDLCRLLPRLPVAAAPPQTQFLSKFRTCIKFSSVVVCSDLMNCFGAVKFSSQVFSHDCLFLPLLFLHCSFP